MKLLIYDDAPEFGGHEQMTVRLVHRLVAVTDIEIAFVLYEGNQTLAGALPSAVKILTVPYKSAGAQVLRSYWSWWHIVRLAVLFRDEAPDLLLVAQGGIAVSSTALLAGRIACLRTVSYIPMTHDEGIYAPTPFKRWVRTFAARPLHFLPHAFVTISRRMAEYLTGRGVSHVEVVENGIEFPVVAVPDRVKACIQLGLDEKCVYFLMIGRVEFWQKRQDLAIEAFAHVAREFEHARLLVVGGGPDLDALIARCEVSKIADKVHFFDWQKDVTPFYAASDCLLLPSRYEGVPLVMLEAMYLGRYVLASDVDGMADVLPGDWLFPSGSVDGMSDRMKAFLQGRLTDHRESNRQRVLDSNSIERFGRNFETVLRRLAEHE